MLTYAMSGDGVDWDALKAALAADRFDNGRTPDQYRRSHENSHAVVIVTDARGAYVGNGRVLSDGVCNAYVVDVWTATAHRRQGIGSEIVRRLLATVPGQHVLLMTEDMADFYEPFGFATEHEALSLVNGTWLDPAGPGGGRGAGAG